MKPFNLFKVLFLASTLLTSLTSYGFDLREELYHEELVLESSSNVIDLLEGKIDTKSETYQEIEKAYAKQVTSPLTTSQSLELKRDSDPDTHPNPDKINQVQLWALFGYTTGDFIPMNKTLRGKNPKAKLQKDSKLLNQIIIMRAALQKIKSFKGKVFRGTHLSSQTLSQHIPGSIVTYPGFLSTSTSREASENFVQNVILVINAKNGKSVRNYSQMPQEDEILFDHNSKFKVLKKKKTKIEFIENPIVDEIELEEI
jgi:hypothetical protein